MLLRSGEHIANLSRRFGHSKVSTTLDYYSHALHKDDARSGDAFEKRYRGYAAGTDREAEREAATFPALIPGLRKTPNPLQDGRLRDVPRARIELATPGFSDLCSTD
jgi:hypothetical protein